MSKIIDGLKVATDIKLKVRSEIFDSGLKPGLAVILVGDDASSHLYVRKKEQACKQVGISFHKYLIEADSPQEDVLKTIEFLNQDKEVDAILVQLPLPSGFDEDKIIRKIDPAKDVDGFHPDNIQLLLEHKPRLIPGLPLGVWKLLEETKEDLKNKQALIIANSPIFTKPTISLLKEKGIDADSIGPKDPNVKEKIKKADVVISAVGACDFIRGEDLKPGSIVIDIGINKDESGQLCGDVNFEEAKEVASHITPVPGGVGPVTVALLLYNALELAKKRHR